MHELSDVNQRTQPHGIAKYGALINTPFRSEIPGFNDLFYSQNVIGPYPEDRLIGTTPAPVTSRDTPMVERSYAINPGTAIPIMHPVNLSNVFSTQAKPMAVPPGLTNDVATNQTTKMEVSTVVDSLSISKEQHRNEDLLAMMMVVMAMVVVVVGRAHQTLTTVTIVAVPKGTMEIQTPPIQAVVEAMAVAEMPLTTRCYLYH